MNNLYFKNNFMQSNVQARTQGGGVFKEVFNSLGAFFKSSVTPTGLSVSSRLGLICPSRGVLGRSTDPQRDEERCLSLPELWLGERGCRSFGGRELSASFLFRDVDLWLDVFRPLWTGSF